MTATTKTQVRRTDKTSKASTPLLEMMDRLIADEKRQREEAQRYPSRTKGGAKTVRTIEERTQLDLEAALAEPMPEGAEADQEIVAAILADQEKHQGQPPVTAQPNQPVTKESNGASVSAFVPNSVMWQAMARRRIEPEGAEDWTQSPVVLDVAVRIVAGERDWVLEVREPSGEWNRLYAGYEPTACAVGLSFFGLRVLDDDLAKIAKLPKLRPAEKARREREQAAMFARSIVSLRR
jgi:hypothetical protein